MNVYPGTLAHMKLTWNSFVKPIKQVRRLWVAVPLSSSRKPLKERKRTLSVPTGASATDWTACAPATLGKRGGRRRVVTYSSIIERPVHLLHWVRKEEVGHVYSYPSPSSFPSSPSSPTSSSSPPFLPSSSSCFRYTNSNGYGGTGSRIDCGAVKPFSVVTTTV